MFRTILQKIEGFIGRLVRRFYSERRRRNMRQLIEQKIVTIGRHSYGNPVIDTYLGSEGKVIIGDFCSISKNVVFVTGGIHPPEWVSTFPFRIKFKMKNAFKDGMPATRGDIIVGSDVWIGTDVMILSGVNIGHGAIIAARSVVTKDIPAYSIAAGIPARVIRNRFTDDIIEKLLAIRWWEWNDARVKEAVDTLSSADIDEFVNKYWDDPVNA